MQIKTDNLDDLINKSHNKELFIQLLDIIESRLKIKGSLFTYNQMTMIGFDYVNYKNTCYDGQFPVVSIAPQKNNISIYIMKVVDDQYIVEKYATPFGKSNYGKSCIRIKKLNEDRITTLNKMLDIVINNNKV